MTNDSFTFGTEDMFESYGIRMLHYDVLLPQLRRRKVTIPGRSGSYDYGAKFYDDRIVRVECDTRRSLTKAQIRELAYALSKKNALRFWNEPELFYLGRIYDTSELDYIGSVGYEFVLNFECDPFAYGDSVQEDVSGSFRLEYAGTAPTPTRLTITNNGDTQVSGIQIRIRERRDTY